MKRKIQYNFKSYQKILLLLLILLATLLFGFINGSFNAVEGHLVQEEHKDGGATVQHHKSAADKRSSGDGKIKKNENDLYGTDSALNSG